MNLTHPPTHPPISHSPQASSNSNHPPTHLPTQSYDKAARDQMMKRLRMYNTSRLYKQTRFNLLSEESEGFAKVLTALDELTEDSVPTTVIHLHSLIGYFDLDPNRVADLILESYEGDLTNTGRYPSHPPTHPPTHVCMNQLPTHPPTHPPTPTLPYSSSFKPPLLPSPPTHRTPTVAHFNRLDLLYHLNHPPTHPPPPNSPPPRPQTRELQTRLPRPAHRPQIPPLPPSSTHPPTPSPPLLLLLLLLPPSTHLLLLLLYPPSQEDSLLSLQPYRCAPRPSRRAVGGPPPSPLPLFRRGGGSTSHPTSCLFG